MNICQRKRNNQNVTPDQTHLYAWIRRIDEVLAFDLDDFWLYRDPRDQWILSNKKHTPSIGRFCPPWAKAETNNVINVTAGPNVTRLYQRETVSINQTHYVVDMWNNPALLQGEEHTHTQSIDGSVSIAPVLWWQSEPFWWLSHSWPENGDV